MPSTAAAAAQAAIGHLNQRFAIITLIALLAILVLYVLAFLPRAIARYSGDSAWKDGWLLRHGAAPDIPRPSAVRRPTIKREIGAPQLQRSASQLDRIARFNREKARLAPPHFPSWTTVFQPFSHYLSGRFAGYSIAQCITLAGYAVLIGITTFLFSNPVSNAQRAGWIALAQYPVSFALGCKNSLVGVLVGRGYERLNYIHRWVGQIMFIATLFHVVGYLVKWTKAGSIEAAMTRDKAIWGTVATGAMGLLALCSLPAVRRWSYTFFYHSHWVGFSILLVATCFHVPAAIPYTLASLGLYTVDQLVRVVKSHYLTASLEYVPELNATRVCIPTLRKGWRAGQHVRLTVVSTGMGLAAATESHPFTIAGPTGDRDGIVLYCKAVGDWTKSLAALAKSSTASNRKNLEAGFGGGKNVNVIIQGPYGGPNNTVFSSFSAALIVCGGSGITFGTAAVQEIVRDAGLGKSAVRVVDLVWVVKDASCLVPLIPLFTRMIEESNAITSISLRIAVHYTRATPFVPEFSLPEHMSIHAGRPDLADVLFGAIGCVTGGRGGSTAGRGVVIGVCGPEGLVEEVRKVERAVGHSVRKAVGGVELCEEAFGW